MSARDIGQLSFNELECRLRQNGEELHEIQAELARRRFEQLSPAERRAQLRVVTGGRS